MVQPLRLLLRDGITFEEKASIQRLLATFVPCHSGKDAADVLSFLVDDSIEYEQAGITRTYLIIDDEAWERGKVQINGYFSIAMKVLYFSDRDRFDGKQNLPAYLIGQLARSIYSEKGAGAEYLDLAISYIKTVNEIIGGMLIYLDCNPDRREYYERQRFSFLQNKKHSDLIQMYRII